MRKYFTTILVTVIAIAISSLLLSGCSRGPGKEWCKEKIREKFDKTFVESGGHPKEGVHYTFGKYEMAKGGKRGRIHVNTKVHFWQNKYYNLCAFQKHDWKFEFWQDEYGKWTLNVGGKYIRKD